MTDTSSPTSIAEQVGGQDSSRLFHRIFTGHTIAKPAMGWAPLTAVVVAANTDSVVVTIDNFPKLATATLDVTIPTFTCNYEPRWSYATATWTQVVPPAGTPCLVVFPPAGSGSGFPWVLAFAGWPN